MSVGIYDSSSLPNNLGWSESEEGGFPGLCDQRQLSGPLGGTTLPPCQRPLQQYAEATTQGWALSWVSRHRAKMFPWEMVHALYPPCSSPSYEAHYPRLEWLITGQAGLLKTNTSKQTVLIIKSWGLATLPDAKFSPVYIILTKFSSQKNKYGILTHKNGM